MFCMRHVSIFTCTSALLLLGNVSAYGQQKPLLVHEIAPFVGIYAPDRYETSLGVGLRYYYRIDDRFGVGAVLGFARARQEYFNKVTSFAFDLGSDKVVYHGARLTYTFPLGRVDTYALIHIGLTHLREENDLTYGIGVGTKIYTHRSFSIRYEFLTYFFGSGRDESSWTNRNVEVMFGLGYYL